MRLVGADEVDHDVGARAVRRLAHRVRDAVPLAEHLVGAELAREPPAALVGVDRDDRADAPRTRRSWSAMWPTPPTPIRAAVVPGTEARHELLDGVAWR